MCRDEGFFRGLYITSVDQVGSWENGSFKLLATELSSILTLTPLSRIVNRDFPFDTQLIIIFGEILHSDFGSMETLLNSTSSNVTQCVSGVNRFYHSKVFVLHKRFKNMRRCEVWNTQKRQLLPITLVGNIKACDSHYIIS